MMDRNQTPWRRKTGESPSGFSLVELLTVMAVVAVMVGLIGFGMTRMGGSKMTLANAQRVASNMFDAARYTALMNPAAAESGGPVTISPDAFRIRVLVHDDPAEPDNYRRRIGVVFGDINTNRWQAVNDGVRLPPGVFYVAPSDTDVDWRSTPGSGSSDTSGGGGTGVMQLAFPRNTLQPAGTGTRWVYYEFDNTGEAVGISRGARFVIGAGRQNPGDPTDIVYDDAAGSGFVLLGSGKVIFFKEHAEVVASVGMSGGAG